MSAAMSPTDDDVKPVRWTAREILNSMVMFRPCFADHAASVNHETQPPYNLNLLGRSFDEDDSLIVTDREGNKVLDESIFSNMQKMRDGEEVEAYIIPPMNLFLRNNPEIFKGHFPWCEEHLPFESVPRVINVLLLNSGSYGKEQHGPKMFVDFVLVAPESKVLGDGDSSSIGALAPVTEFWLDSGAFHHVTGDEGILSNIRDMPFLKTVTVADGSQLDITKVGDIQTPDIQIKDVYYVPGLKMNLISVSALTKRKIKITFCEHHAELKVEEVQVGGAILDEARSLYRLRYLQAA